ncbi:alkaline phosphatase D family protein [Dietzia cinnamea]|uniref:alkaline phosphatase D family protein n=1 Tax=Dietzia cinnamea TaxID=321318 RepID=UPI00223B6641|nr:alkaline phosphatase D family protein [Dietzia cinnamea]MCT2063051.1 alkaline phosphatase D family protein [Dietzia cinnamea]MCT2237656.1 alkaline phosphatase D family protein [Dietzia cinnamea]
MTDSAADPSRSRAGLGRRSVLRAGALAGAAVGAGSLTGRAASAAAAAGGPASGGAASGSAAAVFRHGVASGDPMADRVILWTRVTPTEQATPGSGIGGLVVVDWEISTDPGFATIVRSGTVTTDAGRDHTVKLDCAGLAPDRWYHYRFRALGQTSRAGRTRTAPADGAMPASGRWRVGVVSCSNWEAGFFAGYRHLEARGDLDAIIELGDYIYEYGRGEYTAAAGAVRPHDPPHEIVTLADYRIRLAQYRTDPDLQSLHAHVPWICTWDDHELANNSWEHGAENHQPHEGPFADRKAASARAYFEWMPVRPDSLRDGGHLYRRLRWGSLAELSMLDLRSYRSEDPGRFNGRATDQTGTMTGAEQFDWLARGLASSTARWNVIGNSVMVTPVLIPPLDARTTGALTELLGIPREGITYNSDQWDGYAGERRRLFEVIRATGNRNHVFLTGDIHTSWANEVPLDAADYPGAGTGAVEFVTPSITSNNINDMVGLPEGNPLSQAAQGALTGVNRHVRWADLDRHGFTVVEFTSGYAHADFWALVAREDPASGAYPLASWRSPHGSDRLEPAGPLP